MPYFVEVGVFNSTGSHCSLSYLSAPLDEALVALCELPAEHVHQIGVLRQEAPLRTAPPALMGVIISGLPE